MDKMPINVYQDCAIVFLIHDMILEDLIVECAWTRYNARHLESYGL